jgi:hypothetical protein
MIAVIKEDTRVPATVRYDPGPDVLYVERGVQIPSKKQDRSRGIALWSAESNDEPSGVTVTGFAQNGWHRELPALSQIVGSHLAVDPMEVMYAVQRATKD